METPSYFGKMLGTWGMLILKTNLVLLSSH